MKQFWSIIGLLLLVSVSLSAQSTKKIRELEKQHAALQKQITDSESLLQSTQKDVKSQLDNLALLSGQIDERKRYVETVEKDVEVIQREIDRVKAELVALQHELADKKKKYEKSVMYMYRNKSVQEKLMLEVQRKQKQVANKQQTLLASREAKQQLLHQGEAEKQKLEEQEKERKTLLASLQKKQRGIRQELQKQRKSADRLNAEIDRLIEIEIAAARKRAEEEARRKAAEERKKAEAERKAKEAVKSTVAENKETSAPSVTEKVEVYKVDREDRRLSGVFEHNKGRLPMPITGPYVVVGHYGKYQVQGLRNVRLDNKGIDIKGNSITVCRMCWCVMAAIFPYIVIFLPLV